MPKRLGPSHWARNIEINFLDIKMSDIQDQLGDAFDAVGDSIQSALGRFEILLKYLWSNNYEA